MRSHLTLEQRRDKLKSLKAKSKCMRCGARGHWAEDPECKLPTSQGGRGKAHLAVIADEGLSIPAGNQSAAAFVVRLKSAAARSSAHSQDLRKCCFCMDRSLWAISHWMNSTFLATSE